MTAKSFPTKIIPPHFDEIFLRKPLIALVENQASTPLVWVNGPPGIGKTFFVISLLETLQVEFLWYRLERGENNSGDIFYFLNQAAQRNNPRKNIKLPVFTAEYTDDIDSFARIFFRQLYAILKNDTAIVFDNCQEIEEDASFFSVLQIAVNELPQGMQIYCISRNRPAPVLSRMRLTDDLLDIGAGELRFKASESQAFLKWLNPKIDERTVEYLQSKTRGWAAGMVLLIENLNRGETPEISYDCGGNEFLFDYLAKEILSQLESEGQEFLVKSALFTQFTSKMGKQLTDYRQTTQILDNLVGKNLLTERSAESQPIYTYHPLFRDLLLSQSSLMFSKAEWRELQNNAAVILIKNKRTTEAIPLYQQLQDWSALKELLLQQADSLIKTGRHRSVSKWMQSLPVHFIEKDAWLKYWYAEATKPVEPNVAALLFDKCYDQFIENNDIIGMYSAWQAGVESIFISMDDYSVLNSWFTRFNDLRKNHPTCPSLELKIKFHATAVQSLSLYNPQLPWLKSLVRICERIVRIIPIKTIQASIYTQLGNYYVFAGHLAKLKAITPYLEAAIDDDSLPIVLRILDASLLGIQSLYHGEAEKGLTVIHKGIELSDASGLQLFKGLMLANVIGCHICRGDLKTAEEALQKAFQSAHPKQRMHTALFHSYAAWIAALTGKPSLAFKQNQLALQLSQQIGVEVGYVCSLAFKIQFLAEKQQWQNAEQTFVLLASVVKVTKNNFNLYQYHLTDAWLGYLQSERDRTLSAIRKLFKLIRCENMLFSFGSRPEVLTPLCIFAIENSIEEKIAIRILQIRPLFTSPPLHLEKWPWPVRIFCFHHLHIEIDGKPLVQSGKSQKKILELLLAIIALGSRGVENSQLSQIIWPDSDGDFAIHALETAIHRLRKLIGKQAIIVNAGRVSLNDTYCWIDLWAFHQTAKELDAELQSAARPDLVIKLADRLLRLYRGPFSTHENYVCTQLLQEQLQNKLFNLIDRLVDFHEQRLEPDQVRNLLEKKLELDPTMEATYLSLIMHNMKLGQTGIAMKTFQQCERTLSEGLGIPLSAKIKSLAQQLN